MYFWILLIDMIGAITLIGNPALGQKTILLARRQMAQIPEFQQKHPSAAAFLSDPHLDAKIGLKPHASSRVLQLQPMTVPADFHWNVMDLEGRTIPLSRFRDKVILLNFWAAWCGPCRQEMPTIQKLFEREKTNPSLAILCINVESIRDAKNFLRFSKYTFPVYVANKEIPPLFKPKGLPTSYIISRSGRLMVKVPGAVSWDDPAIARAITQLLAS
jgi:thiol-disulfide isomerase/thioredoxin